jgi:very-short-patch-repair endonuclease
MKVDDVVTIVAGLGGIATTGRLLEAGVPPDAIHRAVAHRVLLLRPRRGIIALRSTPPMVLRAARAGGALAATSAAEFHGLWTPTDSRLHISVRSDAPASLDPRVVIHRDRHHLSAAEKFVVSRESCVRQCSRFLPFEQAVAVLDSALHQDLGGADPHLDLCRLRSALPARLQPVIEAADERAEAGAESLARVRLARAGVIARPQVRIARGIRVDLLIGDRLVVEIGSQEFHAHPDQYESDHDRAAVIVGLGFDLLEFTTLQVMDDWATVEGVILQRVRPRATFNHRF